MSWSKLATTMVTLVTTTSAFARIDVQRVQALDEPLEQGFNFLMGGLGLDIACSTTIDALLLCRADLI